MARARTKGGSTKPKPKGGGEASSARRQTTIAEIVAILATPALGVTFEVASTVARRVVRDHPDRLVCELVPVILAHLDRALLDAA